MCTADDVTGASPPGTVALGVDATDWRNLFICCNLLARPDTARADSGAVSDEEAGFGTVAAVKASAAGFGTAVVPVIALLRDACDDVDTALAADARGDDWIPL